MLMQFHDKVSRYIAALPSPQKEICEAFRALIYDNFPQMSEEYKWNYPAYYNNGKRICLASGFKEHVTLELFYGVHLHDTQGRVGGVGKNTRHIKFRLMGDFDSNYLIDLIKQSIALSV